MSKNGYFTGISSLLRLYDTFKRTLPKARAQNLSMFSLGLNKNEINSKFYINFINVWERESPVWWLFFPFSLATVNLPHSCSFEDRAICDYSQSMTDTADWERNSGGTITVNTGPTSAFDGQYYMYLESSFPQTEGDFAVWVKATAQGGHYPRTVVDRPLRRLWSWYSVKNSRPFHKHRKFKNASVKIHDARQKFSIL